ncbi:hypothetical protein M569_03354 [Genlisea aurea]|uniref:Uncharacterized protein n=1 Tax=Genlisea aurea TaxID=192259 RepID=S8CVJ8_9LAMI|nr:hypothetical protein M569_03354 [Genlisea aurea]
MDPSPTNFPILSYVMSRLPPAIRRSLSNASDSHDVENPAERELKPLEPYFEIAERMPHLNNPALISAMRRAVGDVVQSRSTLQVLGKRPDHETVEVARLRLSEIQSRPRKEEESEEAKEEMEIYKAVVSIDEMHESYGKMLSDAERRLEKIYEAAAEGIDLIDEEEAAAAEMDEEVVRILSEAEAGKEIEKVDLSGRKLKILPEALGKLRSLILLNLSNNQLQVLPDSIAGLENLEELYLSGNLLETLPDSIGLLFKLKTIDVSGNKLLALPDTISQCRMLVELDASFNRLTYLPTNIGYELVNLKRLSVHLNKLRSLPASVGEMKSLLVLDAHFNELRGLPASIGRLANLEILNLSGNFNDLTQLPDAISDLTSLKELDLSNNQIHALPDDFGRLLNLSKLKLEQNPLAVPPKEVADRGAEAVRSYMAKRRADLAAEEERKSTEMQQQSQAGLLMKSTSWLNNLVTNVSDYMGSPRKSNPDPFLDQQF